ncbi:MAG: hypothetical protein PHS49_04350 [Candidatus Gracilibacteria bacterium]|nr:hypothetical protein [Candidatus Gracilibacteria bacterium]
MRFEKTIILEELNNGKPDLTSQQYILTPNITRYYHNGGKKSSKEYNEYTYTSYAQYNRKGTDLDYPAKIWVDYKINANDSYTYSTEKIEVISAYHKQEVFKQLHSKVRTRLDFVNKNLKLQNLSSTYDKIKRNIECTNGCIIWDVYTKIDKAEVNADLEFLAGALFEYKLKNDGKFLRNFEDEVRRQMIEKPNANENEIKKGVKDGTIEGLKEILQGYNDLFNTSFNDFLIGIEGFFKGAYDLFYNTDKILKSGYQTINNLYETAKKIPEVIKNLGDYERAKFGSYTSTHVGYELIDPIGKLKLVGLLGGGLSKIIWLQRVMFTVEMSENGYSIKKLNVISGNLLMSDLSNKYSFYAQGIKQQRISIGLPNGIEYKFKNTNKIQEHVQGTRYFDRDKSYYNSTNLDEVYNLQMDAMNKIPRADFDLIKGQSKGYIVDMGDLFGTHNSGELTNKMKIIVTSDGAVHGFPVDINSRLGLQNNIN